MLEAANFSCKAAGEVRQPRAKPDFSPCQILQGIVGSFKLRQIFDQQNLSERLPWERYAYWFQNRSSAIAESCLRYT